MLSLGNNQESPQVEADREKIVAARDGGDGPEGACTGEGDCAQGVEGEASEEEEEEEDEEEDEDGSTFEAETETETTETETDEDDGGKFNRYYFLGWILEYPATLFAYYRMRIATIVIYLVLQSTPAHVNEVAGYSEMLPNNNNNNDDSE